MADDAELARIRQARLQELAAQGGGPGAGPSDDDQDAQRAAQDEARSSILSQILTPDARDRLNRIKLVNENRARGLEDSLMQLARSGRIRARITDKELVSMLEGASEQQQREEKKIVFNRRKAFDDDDDLDF